MVYLSKEDKEWINKTKQEIKNKQNREKIKKDYINNRFKTCEKVFKLAKNEFNFIYGKKYKGFDVSRENDSITFNYIKTKILNDNKHKYVDETYTNYI